MLELISTATISSTFAMLPPRSSHSGERTVAPGDVDNVASWTWRRIQQQVSTIMLRLVELYKRVEIRRGAQRSVLLDIPRRAGKRYAARWGWERACKTSLSAALRDVSAHDHNDVSGDGAPAE